MHLSYASAVLRRSLLALLLGALVGAGLASAALLATQSWETKALVAMRPEVDQFPLRSAQPARFCETQAQRVMGDAILGSAAKAVGESADLDALRRAITVECASDSDTLEITVQGTTVEQSRARATALLSAMRSTPIKGIDLDVLWTEATKRSGSLPLYLVAGAVVGAALGGLIALASAAVRRPVLDTDTFAVPRNTSVYPKTMPAADKVTPGEIRELAAWLTSRAEHRPVTVLVPSDAGAASGKLVAALTDAAAKSSTSAIDVRFVGSDELLGGGGGGGASAAGEATVDADAAASSALRVSDAPGAGHADLLLLVAPRGRVTEVDLAHEVATLGALVDQSVVVVTGDRR